MKSGWRLPPIPFALEVKFTLPLLIFRQMVKFEAGAYTTDKTSMLALLPLLGLSVLKHAVQARFERELLLAARLAMSLFRACEWRL